MCTRNPTLWGPDPSMIFAHDFGHDGFRSMVLDVMVFGP